jgi:AraC-like DNA-binding protein
VGQEGSTLPPTRHVTETTDLELALHYISEGYSTVRLSRTGDRNFLRLTRQSMGPVRLDHNEIMMSFDFMIDPIGSVMVSHVLSGMIRRESADHSALFGPGDVVITSDPGQPYAGRVEDADIRLAMIEPSLLSQVASTSPSRTAGPLRFTSIVPASAAAARHIRRTLAYLHKDLLTNADAMSQPLITGHAARLVAAAALATFPNTAVTDPTAMDRRDASPATLRRAIAFIDEHADLDISAADIAAAAHVTIRAVQLAFRRHLDTTPTAYLRRVRLDLAHRALQVADARQDTVTAIAARWGFASPGRFSAYYRDTFGVLPSHTLKS